MGGWVGGWVVFFLSLEDFYGFFQEGGGGGSVAVCWSGWVEGYVGCVEEIEAV